MRKSFKKAAVLAAAALMLSGLFGSAALAAEPAEMTIASTAMNDMSMARVAELWKADLEASGLFKINLKFNGVLGGEREGAEAVQMGTIEGNWISDVALSVIVPEIAYTNLPYLFSTYEQVDKFYMNGFVGEDVKKKVEAKGFKVLGLLENDFRGLTTSNRPVTKPEDLKGMKIRVPEVPVYIELFRKLGTQPTPMAVTELATALQQRTVDGQDNGVLLTKSNGYYQLQKYMTLTNHIYNGGAILVNPEFFEALSAEQKKVLTEVSAKYATEQIKVNREDVSKYLGEIKASGVEVTVLTPESMAAFVEIGRSCWGEAEKTFGKEWIDRLKNEVK